MLIVCKSVARLFRDVVTPKIEKEDISHFGKDLARQGYISLLQWAKARNVPLKDVAVGAAETGRLDVLKWAQHAGYDLRLQNICEIAAEGGHLEVLQWTRQQGCPWNERTCASAAGGGHLEVLKWAVANGCPYEEGMRQHVIRRHGEDAIQWKVQSLLSNHSHFGKAASDRPLLVDMWNAFFSGKS